MLLQFTHRKLVPSVHTETLNPEIHWEKTPFFVQRQLADWEPTIVDGAPNLRRACVNAFGAGGSNAHLIVEEYPEIGGEPKDAPSIQTPMLIVLSAKDKDRLVKRASDLVAYLSARMNGGPPPPRLLDVAYTLQLGRDPMKERLAFLANSLQAVIEKLTLFAAEATEIVGLFRGCCSEDIPADPATPAINTLAATPAELTHAGAQFAAWWVAGGEPDWESLYEGLEPRRISLPTYRFSRERCWFRETVSDTNPNSVSVHKKELSQGSALAGENILQTQLLTEIRQLLGAALKLSPARIGDRQRLVECGLDSVTTVSFLKQLEREYDIQVSADSLIEYPTLESFVGFLLRHHVGALRSTGDDGEAASVEHGEAATTSTYPGNSADGGSNGHRVVAAGLVQGQRALRKLALAPLDHLFVGPRRFAIQVLYYFESHLDFAQLQSALCNVAGAFYPVNSRLLRHQEQYFISECPDEPDFAEIHCGAQAMPPEQDRPESFAPFQVGFDPRLPKEKLAKFRLFQLPGAAC